MCCRKRTTAHTTAPPPPSPPPTVLAQPYQPHDYCRQRRQCRPGRTPLIVRLAKFFQSRAQERRGERLVAQGQELGVTGGYTKDVEGGVEGFIEEGEMPPAYEEETKEGWVGEKKGWVGEKAF